MSEGCAAIIALVLLVALAGAIVGAYLGFVIAPGLWDWGIG